MYKTLDAYLTPLLPFLSDQKLTEIAVNNPFEVYTESLEGWYKHYVEALSFDWCRSLAIYVAGYNTKQMNQDNPILSATLPDGARIQVVRPPVTSNGIVSITIRKPSANDFSLNQLRDSGAFDNFVISKPGLKPFEHELKALLETKKIEEFLTLAVKTNRNIVLAGKTGSGKTTVLKALTRLIPANERLVTVEDVHEVTLKGHSNKVHLFYGKANITASQVIESCLRMKPDRIMLAECRGAEAWEFLSALDTDHSGMTTIHAGGAEEAFSRLAGMVRSSEVGRTLPNDYVLQKLYSTIDIVLYYQNRKLKEVYYEPERKYS